MKDLVEICCPVCSPHPSERNVPPDRRKIPNAPVQADVDPLWPGLAVHPLHQHDNEGRIHRGLFRSMAVRGGEEREQVGWVVTHIRSGIVLGAVYERKEQALVARQMLGDLPVDWTLASEQLQSPVLMVQMAPIVAACGGVGYGYGGVHGHG